MFSKAELSRYSRHMSLANFGEQGQQRLKEAKVLVIGAGGLGSPVLLYLAAAGVGTIGIVDFDRIEDSNLQRQVLFGSSQIGAYKAEMAKHRLLDLNPYIEVRVHNCRLSRENALEMIKDYDIVADGSDNFATRYLVNDACVLLDKTDVYASIFKFEGQISVFNADLGNGERGVQYRDLFPTPPPPGMIPSCAEGGVLGVLPGIVGSLQANEVIKVITGVGEPLVGKLLLFNALDLSTHILEISENPTKEVPRELLDYEIFCGVAEVTDLELSQEDFKTWQAERRAYLLIDVRETYEREVEDMGGVHIPMHTISSNLDQLPKDKDLVFYCQSGQRSKAVATMLREDHQYRRVFSLIGGMNQ